MLARSLQGTKETNGSYPEVENYQLPSLHVYRLSDLEHSIDNLVELAQSLKNQTNILTELGFDVGSLDELFDNKVIPFLTRLKPKTQERINDLQRKQSTSSSKIAAFKDQVVKGFTESVIIRDLLKHYGLFEDRTAEQQVKKEIVRIGINQIDEKSAFFEE